MSLWSMVLRLVYHVFHGWYHAAAQSCDLRIAIYRVYDATIAQSRLLGRSRCRSVVLLLPLSYHNFLVFLFDIRFLCVAVAVGSAALLRACVWTCGVLSTPRSLFFSGQWPHARAPGQDTLNLLEDDDMSIAIFVALRSSSVQNVERRICDLHLG